MAAVEAIKKAIRSGDIDSLEEEKLHELGLGVNCTLGNDGYTPLHWACHYGRAEVLEHFIDLGADIHECTEQGWTAAHICAIRGCTICLNILCSCGLDLTTEDSRGYACIHLAAAHGKCSALQAIIKAGVDVTVVDRRGWTILHHAAFHSRLNILQQVLSLDIDSNAGDKDGNTPAHLAAMEGHLECLKLLVHHDNQTLDVVTSRNNDGSTPKDLAVRFQKQDCVDFLALAENEAEVFDGDDYPGHSAVSEGNVQLLGMLLVEEHCGVDDQDQYGATAAHKAAGKGHLECLQLLIDHGANIKIKDNSGDTPKDVAKRCAKLECLALLSKINQESTDNASEDDREQRSNYQSSAQARIAAGEKVAEMQHLLDTAKAHYYQLGGELCEDREIEEMKAEHKKRVSELESKLEYERERREELEAELDEARKKLREAINLLDQYQSLNSQSQASFTSEYHHIHRPRRRTSSNKKVPVSGGFVKIGHV